MDDLFLEENTTKIFYKKTGKRLAGLLFKRRKLLSFCICLVVLSMACKMLGPLIIKHAIDVNLGGSDLPGFFKTLFVFLAVSALFLFFNYTLIVQMQKLAQDVLLEIKDKMFRHLLAMHIDYFNKTSAGSLSARIESDTSALAQLFTFTAIMIVRDFLLLFGALAIMIYFNPLLTAVALIPMPLLLVVSIIYIKYSSKPFLLARKYNSDLTGAISEKVQGIVAVQTYNRQNAAFDEVTKLNDKKFRATFKAGFYSSAYWTIMSFIEPASIALVLLAGGNMAIAGIITVGTVIMFIMYLENMLEPILMVGEHLAIIQKAFSAGQRIFEILDMQPKVTDKIESVPKKDFEDKIEFKNVYFKYEEDAGDVLKDINFEIKKGSKTAIIGETGSGKSTIINLLFKFYNVTKGDITIDGISIADIKQSDLRSVFGLITQDIYLFPGTLSQNIKLMDNSIKDDKVIKAINDLNASEYFPVDGLGKQIREGGKNLSLGERQLISILRAMVLDPKVIVFDEATSAVDPHTEKIIQAALDKLFKGRTSIVIAHRLSTIQNADKIISLTSGRITETGTHDELIEKGGNYSKYYKLQLGVL